MNEENEETNEESKPAPIDSDADATTIGDAEWQANYRKAMASRVKRDADAARARK